MTESLEAIDLNVLLVLASIIIISELQLSSLSRYCNRGVNPHTNLVGGMNGAINASG